jgi:hypothetical protein
MSVDHSNFLYFQKITDSLKLSIKSVSLLRCYFAVCFRHFQPSSGVYEQGNASTFITRLRVAVDPLLSTLTSYVKDFTWD